MQHQLHDDDVIKFVERLSNIWPSACLAATEFIAMGLSAVLFRWALTAVGNDIARTYPGQGGIRIQFSSGTNIRKR